MAKNECTWRNQKDHAKKILPLIHKYQEIILFDTETNGLGKSAKIIQFSGVHYRILSGYRLQEVNKLDIYINPEEPLPEKITELTGITDAMLKDAPNEREVANAIYGFLDSCPLWAAYNASFDLRMLDQMSNRVNILYPAHQCLDVLEMARDFVKKEESGSHKLGDILHFLFPEHDFQFHSAIEDVRATAEVISQFLPLYKDAFQRETDTKRQLRLEWASAWQNPRMLSQQRIKLKLNEGDYGDIYWDIVANRWSCKSTKAAKAMFEDVDLANLEKQVLSRYGWKYDARDMSALSRHWMAEKRKNTKNLS